LKLKSLLVITLLVLGCSFASAQSFGFLSVGGGSYCNYEVISFLSGTGVAQGVDNLTAACGLPVNATFVGFKDSLPAVDTGGLVSGAGITYGDNIYDAESEAYTGAQWTVFSHLKCNKKINGNTKYSWIGVAGISGFFFGDNYGYLGCTVPGHEAVGRGLSTGKAQVPHKQ